MKGYHSDVVGMQDKTCLLGPQILMVSEVSYFPGIIQSLEKEA